MGQSNWEADKMLDVYIHDFLLKKNLQATAKSFMSEAKVSADPIAIDAPRGFLFEWWSVFWDIFIARTNEKHSEVAAAYIELQSQQMKVKEQQPQHQLQMQQYQLMQQRHPQLMRRDNNNVVLNGSISSVNSDGILMPSTGSVPTGKIYEDCLKNSVSLNPGASPHLLDARMGQPKSTNNLPGQLLQGNPGNLSTALQAQSQQRNDIKGEPLDPSTLYGQGITQARSVLGGSSSGLGQDVNSLPLKGWPLTGIDQLSRNLGAQVQRPSLSANQFPLLSPQHETLTQVQAQGNCANTEIDPGRVRALGRGALTGKDGKSTAIYGSIGSPMQSGPSRVFRKDQEHLMQMQQSSTQQLQDQLQQQQQLLQQNNRKRKQPTSSGPANSTGTANTVGTLTSPPMTPSTHTAGDSVVMAGNFSHANSMSKHMNMYGADGMGGLASSSNHMDDLESFGDVASLGDHVDSFLSHDGDGADLYATLKKSPAEQNMQSSKGFAFSEVGCIRTNENKVVCCDFSSDGKFLVSAGHEKKVVLWNMETLETWSSNEEHSSIVTDIRFRPEATQFATSSFDTTVRLWDAAAPTYTLHTYRGHNSHVTALDFHPKKTDLFCSCDFNGEIRLWSSCPPYGCSRVSKDAQGAMLQVRFQPRIGQLLAAASENLVAILDVETQRKITEIPGHNNELHSLCWHSNGDYLAIVCQDSVKVWSIATEKFIHELSSKGSNFRSCVFHPNNTNLLIIGGYQTLQLWNMVENQTMAVQAHDDLVAALAHSSQGMVASVSHDHSVKIWK